MNVSNTLLLILLLPIYTQAMEPEQSNIGKGISGLAYMAALMEQQSNPIEQRQSVEMEQDPTGSHRGRSLTADHPNPAALVRTPTSTTDGSTPDASIPGSIVTSKAQLPSLPGNTSQLPSPSSSATKLPGLGASSANLLASYVPLAVYKGPGDDEFYEIIEKEVAEMLEKCDFMWSPTTKKRFPKSIAQSADEKSSGEEKKVTPKKSRSGTGLEIVSKQLATNKKEFYQDLISKISKAVLIKINKIHHDTLYGRGGLAPLYTFFGVNMGAEEQNRVPLNSLSSVLKPIIEDELTQYAVTAQKNNFKKDCCTYTLLGANLAMGAAVLAVSLANYYV